MVDEKGREFDYEAVKQACKTIVGGSPPDECAVNAEDARENVDHYWALGLMTDEEREELYEILSGKA